MTSVRESAWLQTLASGFFSALLRPDETFPALLPASLPSVLPVVVFYMAAFGASRPNLLLAALGAQIAFGMLFRVVYAGSYRHQGLYLLFLLVLYWIFVESSDRRTVARPGRLLFNAGLCAMLILIVANVARSPGAVWSDITRARSSSKSIRRVSEGVGNLRGRDSRAGAGPSAGVSALLREQSDLPLPGASVWHDGVLYDEVALPPHSW